MLCLSASSLWHLKTKINSHTAHLIMRSWNPPVRFCWGEGRDAVGEMLSLWINQDRLSDRGLRWKLWRSRLNLPEETGNSYLCRLCWHWPVHIHALAYSIQSEAYEIGDAHFLVLQPSISKTVLILLVFTSWNTKLLWKLLDQYVFVCSLKDNFLLTPY